MIDPSALSWYAVLFMVLTPSLLMAAAGIDDDEDS